MSEVIILVERGYEELELWVPYYRFLEAGLSTTIVGDEEGKTYAGKHGMLAESQSSFSEIRPEEAKVILIPGGWAPDRLRQHKEAVSLVQQASKSEATIAAICHGGSLLVSAGVVSNRSLTSYYSIRDDLAAAGANWVDEPVVIDGNLITSRTPSDLPQFMSAILDSIAE